MPVPLLLGLGLHYSLTFLFPCPLQNLWFANPGGSNSMPSQSRSSVQRTHSLPVHSSPQAILMFPPGKVPQPLAFCLHNTLNWPLSSLLFLLHLSTSPHPSNLLSSWVFLSLPCSHFNFLSQIFPSFLFWFKICISSLCRSHTNLLCIIPILLHVLPKPALPSFIFLLSPLTSTPTCPHLSLPMS